MFGSSNGRAITMIMSLRGSSCSYRCQREERGILPADTESKGQRCDASTFGTPDKFRDVEYYCGEKHSVVATGHDDFSKRNETNHGERENYEPDWHLAVVRVLHRRLQYFYRPFSRSRL